MEKQPRCLQESTGSCMGCPMQDAAAKKLSGMDQIQRPKEIIMLSRTLCPEGNIMQRPHIKQTPITM